jgi:hypothetical protein
VFARKVDAATHQLTATLGTKMAAFDSFSPASQFFCIFRSQRNILDKRYFFPLCILASIAMLLKGGEACRGCPNDVYQIPIKL